MKVTVVSIQKGGNGKTATAVNLSLGLSLHLGRRVLLIDLDPQGDSSKALPYEVKNAMTMSDVIAGRCDITEALSTTEDSPYLNVVRANAELENIELDLSPSIIHGFRSELQKFEGVFDHIIIDTRPSLGPLMQMALMASDEVLTPIGQEFSSVDKLPSLIDIVERARAITGRDIKHRFVQTQVPTQRRLVKDENLNQLLKLKIPLLPFCIPEDRAEHHAATYDCRPIMVRLPEPRSKSAYISLSEVIANG